MFTDMVGYSALLQRDEANGLQVLDEHRSRARALFPEYAGVELKTLGDGFLVCFDRALEAVRCGLALQADVRGRNQQAPPNKRFSIRIGIHCGDVSLQEGDVLGDAVNIAARIEPLARPGCLCITEEVLHSVEGLVTARVIRLGRATLKHFSTPVTLYEVVPEGTPLRPLQRQAGFFLRRKGVRQVLGATAALALAGGGYRIYRDRTACAEGPALMAEVWGAAIKPSLVEAMRATRSPRAEQVWASTERLLDLYARGWLDAYRTACEDTRAGREPPAMFALRRGCLDRRLQEMRALTGVLKSGDAAVLDSAVQATFRLSDVAACANPTFLTSAQERPLDPEQQARRAQLVVQLAEAKALQDAGKYDGALERAEAALEEARSLQYSKVEAEATFRLARIEVESGRYAAGEERMFEAFLRAQASGHEAVAVEAAVELTELTAYYAARPAEGMRWSRIAETLLEHFSGMPHLQAKLLTNIGSIHYREGRFATSEAAHRRALELLERGDQEFMRIHVRNRLSGALFEQGRFQEQRTLDLENVETYERLLGPAHPALIYVVQHLAAAELGLGQYESALAHLDRALEIAQNNTVMQKAYVGQTRGATLVKLGRVEEAIVQLETTRAVLTRELGANHPDLLDTLEPLARAELARGRYHAAIEECDALQRLLRPGVEHPAGARCLGIQADAQLRLGQHPQAMALYDRAIELMQRSLGRENALLPDLLNARGLAYLMEGNRKAALADFRRSLAVAEKRVGNPAALAAAQFGVVRSLPFGVTSVQQAQQAAAALNQAQGVDVALRSEIEAWVLKAYAEQPMVSSVPSKKP